MSIEIKINGKTATGREGATILDTARENEIYIPTLCFLDDLPPIGSCRLCVVEVEGSRTLVGSCHTPITKGMVIQTHSPKVVEARRVLVELMLGSHPDSCLVCEKANICKLREVAADLDIGLPRFRMKKHYFPIEDANPHIVRDMSKCIICRRCVAACSTLKGDKLFGMAYRGFNTKVIYGLDQPIASDEACKDCDTCICLCPTGALAKPFSLRAGKEKQGPALVVRG
jgi:formate dehydrogenase alpha subunit